jgi:hypothetical protein
MGPGFDRCSLHAHISSTWKKGSVLQEIEPQPFFRTWGPYFLWCMPGSINFPRRGYLIPDIQQTIHDCFREWDYMQIRIPIIPENLETPVRLISPFRFAFTLPITMNIDIFGIENKGCPGLIE